MADTDQLETIRIYARIRPCKERASVSKKQYRLDRPEPGDENEPQLHFHLPKNESEGLVNNSRENFDFRFNRVFDQSASQEEVFDLVAKNVIDNVLEGYNGTIFAYGQTGSGKTFTITGGPERYCDRGLIPRSIQYIFKQIRESRDTQYTVNVSYIEIYNESGYDLLDNSRDYKKLEDLPKVTLQEDTEDHIHLRNLSNPQVATEEDALNLLFIGDTNKMIAETPSNPASSRSHCLFIVTLTSRKEGEDRIRKSKLHLVDLAGSERVSRTKIEGLTLKEAKYINLSLHYLEQVIVALHEKSLNRRSHIPYRNSMMTSILRDSLGGNCKTSMVATLAVEDILMEETISTCRFAQRVALIKNEATVNEEVDLKFVVEKLKRQIESLKSEIALLKGGDSHSHEALPDYELERVNEAVEIFLKDPDPNARLLFDDFRKLQAANTIFKSRIKILPDKQRSVQPYKPQEEHSSADKEPMAEIVNLKQLLTQRDQEIAVLVSMLKEKDTKQSPSRHAQSPNKTEPLNELSELKAEDTVTRDADGNTGCTSVVRISSEQKTVAFEEFKKSYEKFGWIEHQKMELKERYSSAKALGEEANSYRLAVNHLKLRYEKLSMQNIMSKGLKGEENVNVAAEVDAELRSVKNEIEIQRTKYRDAFARLKDMKGEIEHRQHTLQSATVRMQREFEQWLSTKTFKDQCDISTLHSPRIQQPILPPSQLEKAMPRISRPSSSRSNKSRLGDFKKSSIQPINNERSTSAFGQIADASVEKDLVAFYKAKEALKKLRGR